MKHFLNLIAGISAFTALSLHTSTAEAIFASVKSTGMAATSISYPLDSLAGAYNPAGIASVGDRFDVEAAWVHDFGHTTIHGNQAPSPVPINGHYNGMKTKDVFPVGFGICKNWNINCDWDIAFGLLLYNRNYQKTTYDRPLVLFGTSKPGLEYLHETISPIIAVKIWDSHTIGISTNFQIERLKVNGIQQFDNILQSIAPGHVTNRGYSYAHGWGLTVGYYGQLTNELSLGVTYQPETHMSRFIKYEGFLAERGKLNIPRKIGAGIAYRFTPCFVAAFDIEHIHWKPIKSLSNRFPSVQRLGAKHGPGFGFRDQMYYRIGIEWRFDECWTARLGFRHARTPIRNSQTAVNILTLDTVENFITAGLTWEVNACSEVSFAGAYGFANKVKGHNSIPEIPFGGGEADLKEQKFAIGLAWGLKY
jgi:long-chain fatty acid transport protein